MPFAGIIVIVLIIAVVIYGINQNQQFDSGLGSGVGFSGTPSQQVLSFAGAIGIAEGFGQPGAIPTLANNPGDLVIPGWTGGTLGAGISVFPDIQTGNNYLYHQLNLIVNGQSRVYSLMNDTITTMAQKWTATDPVDWAINVANVLGVDPNTPLSEVLS